MSVQVVINRSTNGIYNGMRQVLGTTVVDWSDANNPDLKAILMTPDHAAITVHTLNQLGYENVEIMSLSQDAEINWWVYGAFAILVGYILATALL